jgi:hypothetical protein
MSATYAVIVRRTALTFINQYGDDAVEVIRDRCVRAYEAGHRGAFEAWRDVGVVADGILLARDHVRRMPPT